jgi:hypothetical protein
MPLLRAAPCQDQLKRLEHFAARHDIRLKQGAPKLVLILPQSRLRMEVPEP